MDGLDTGMGKCPVMHGSNTMEKAAVTAWWPNTLNLDILHQHDTKSNPLAASTTGPPCARSTWPRCAPT